MSESEEAAHYSDYYTKSSIGPRDTIEPTTVILSVIVCQGNRSPQIKKDVLSV